MVVEKKYGEGRWGEVRGKVELEKVELEKVKKKRYGCARVNCHSHKDGGASTDSLCCREQAVDPATVPLVELRHRRLSLFCTRMKSQKKK